MRCCLGAPDETIGNLGKTGERSKKKSGDRTVQHIVHSVTALTVKKSRKKENLRNSLQTPQLAKAQLTVRQCLHHWSSDSSICCSPVWVIESQNGWVGRDLKAHPVPPRAMGRAATQQLRLPRAPSSLALNAPRDGAPTASLDSPCQGLTALYVKNFCLTSYLNLRLFVSQSVVIYPRGRQEA